MVKLPLAFNLEPDQVLALESPVRHAQSNRGTYAQIVVLSNPTVSAESILPLGQSGFIRLGPSNTPEFDSRTA